MPPAPRPIAIRMLGAELRIAADPRAGRLVELLERDLGMFFLPGADAGPAEFEASFASAAPVLRTPAGDVELARDDPEGHAAGIVFRELLDRVDRFVVLHAAAVEHAGRAFLVAGPTGSGKTTLALALVERGLRLLSDDFAPLERGGRRIHPFPKSLGVRGGAAAQLADRVAQVRGEDLALGAGRWTLAPAPLGGIVFFNGLDAAPAPLAPYRFAIATAHDPAPLVRELARLDGVSVIERGERSLVAAIDPARARGAAIQDALARSAALVLDYGVAGAPPPPGREPRLLPIAPSAALVLLVREVQNRRPGGRLLQTLGGDAAALAAEIAPAIAGVPLAWLVTGEPRASAELLEREFSRWSA
ncbi:MAG: hypothetical protein KBD01_09625 [Acidobacteria bacterium]|nr:hypothetical protein [Acidobacteriota bacterium]